MSSVTPEPHGSDQRDDFPLLTLHENTGPAPHLTLSALRAAALLDRLVARSLSPFGLHHAQLNALLFLRRQGTSGIRPSVLGEFLCVSRPNVTKLLARLKSRELIEERPDTTDRRAVLIFATPQGEAIAQRAHEALSGDLASTVEVLSPHDGASLCTLLDRFRDVLAATLCAHDESEGGPTGE